MSSVLWRLFSTVRDSFNSVKGIQYIGGYLQCMLGDNINPVGDHISTVEGIPLVQVVSFSTVGVNISTVEVMQYSGDKELKY